MKLSIIIPCYYEINNIDFIIEKVKNIEFENKKTILIDELTKEIRSLGYQIYNVDGSQVNGKLKSGEYCLH